MKWNEVKVGQLLSARGLLFEVIGKNVTYNYGEQGFDFFWVDLKLIKGYEGELDDVLNWSEEESFLYPEPFIRMVTYEESCDCDDYVVGELKEPNCADDFIYLDEFEIERDSPKYYPEAEESIDKVNAGAILQHKESKQHYVVLNKSLKGIGNTNQIVPILFCKKIPIEPDSFAMYGKDVGIVQTGENLETMLFFQNANKKDSLGNYKILKKGN